jgi:hypothetical protein
MLTGEIAPLAGRWWRKCKGLPSDCVKRLSGILAIHRHRLLLFGVALSGGEETFGGLCPLWRCCFFRWDGLPFAILSCRQKSGVSGVGASATISS